MAFADIFQELSSLPEALSTRGATPGKDAKFEPITASPDADASSDPVTLPDGAPVATRGNQKGPVGLAPARSGSFDSDSKAKGPAVQNHQQNILTIPAPIAELSVLKPKALENAPAGAAKQESSVAQPTPAVRPPSEAALTVVIRTDNPAVTPAPGNGAGQAQAVAPADAGSPPPESAGSSGDIATSGDAAQPIAQAAGYRDAAAGAAASLFPEGDGDRRKPANGLSETAGANGQPTAPLQNLQLKTETTRTPDNATPRSEAPRQTTSLPEPRPEERPASQPLRSVALEFTPDGARDVRVRLSERGGEVHVSLHATDPAITKNLRDGVADLAGVLQHAGYDANAWTSGRQHQENPQQPDEQAPPQRSQSGAGEENFEGILQYPDREVS